MTFLFFLSSGQVTWLVTRLTQNNVFEGPLSVFPVACEAQTCRPSWALKWMPRTGLCVRAGCLLGVCSAWDTMINGNIWRNSAFSFSLSLPEEQLWQHKGDWESAFIFSLVWQSQIFLNRIESDSLQHTQHSNRLNQPACLAHKDLVLF